MKNLLIEEIIKEARSLHPDISDSIADSLSVFLESEINKDELNTVSLKQIDEKLLMALMKTIEKSEN